MNKHLITEVLKGSIAWDKGIVPGDFLISINDNEIVDVFDYRFYCKDTDLKLGILKRDCTNDDDIKYYYVNKSEDDDIGLIFNSSLMDEYRSCSNKCIFCFIDQMPEGLRDTLYFKDDDMRLSFLQGNYVTLTNLSDSDIDRIIKYKLEPVNISFHTTNPELRCRMLNNRFAGEALKKADKLYENGISMNGQIVLCRGINDNDELEKTLSDLYKYVPVLESLSIVPVGLTKYRDGLYTLSPFNKDDAKALIKTVKKWQNKAYMEHNIHYVHASDEWYILADEPLPNEDVYDGYLQIENGVGMLTSLITEFNEGLDELKEALGQYFGSKDIGCKAGLTKRLFKKHFDKKIYEASGVLNISKVVEALNTKRTVTIITGMLSYKFIKQLADDFMREYENIRINVYPVKNDFFGENITVTGLLTGRDIINQLAGKETGDALLISENMLKADADVFLDDVTLADIENSLHSSTCIVKSNGRHLIENIIGVSIYGQTSCCGCRKT